MAAAGKKTKTVSFNFHGQKMSKEFIVDTKYEVGDVLGCGAYGVVTGGTDGAGSQIAIKRIEKVFDYAADAKRAVRELKVLGMLDHENVLNLMDIMTIDPATKDKFDVIYLVTDRVDTDLDQLIKNGDGLTPDQIQYFMYQLFKGLKYLHSAGVLHRDLKPANCLVDVENMKFKIADFGLARPVADSKLTAAVVTQHYRAPEVIVDRSVYGPPVDVWSAITILAECFTRKPFIMVRGVDQVAQLEKIISYCGKPTEAEITAIMNDNARKYVMSLPAARYTRKNFRDLLPEACPDLAVDLVNQVLKWHDVDRLSAEGCLEHPYFEDVRDEDEETSAPQQFKPFDFENQELSDERLRALIFNEMLLYHPEVGEHKPAVDGVTGI